MVRYINIDDTNILMTDEKPTIQEIREATEAMTTATKEAREKIEELKEFQAQKLISGDVAVTKVEDKPKEETPAEYAAKVLSGEVSDK